MTPDWMEAAHEALYVADDFAFANGQRADIKLRYRTLGQPTKGSDGGISNAVLALHGTTGSGKQFLQPSFADHLFGPGQPLDVSRYFIILPDAIGHGGSSKPSDGLRAAFPRYGYTDILEGQHRLLTEGLGVTHLRLVFGPSMGGMLTWLWGQRHPGMMDALMPLASLPESVSGRNLLWRRLLIAAIRGDPAYEDGNYSGQPGNLGFAWNVFKLMADSPEHLAKVLTRHEDADRHVAETAEEALRQEDANDVIWEFAASEDYHPAEDLSKITAPLLAVNFVDDAINPAELGGLERAIKQVKNGRAVMVPVGSASKGHQTLSAAEVWKDSLRELLAQTTPGAGARM
jgi:homoserine O-acetyltransferase/O-succinyltransferase